jgi:hypothetical protein
MAVTGAFGTRPFGTGPFGPSPETQDLSPGLVVNDSVIFSPAITLTPNTQYQRGFDFGDTLRLFQREHRRETEELEVHRLIALENKIIAEAILPFVG